MAFKWTSIIKHHKLALVIEHEGHENFWRWEVNEFPLAITTMYIITKSRIAPGFKTCITRTILSYRGLITEHVD